MMTWMMEIRTNETTISVVAEKDYLMQLKEEWKQNKDSGILDVSGMCNNAKREGIEVSIRNEAIDVIAVFEI